LEPFRPSWSIATCMQHQQPFFSGSAIIKL
jgi:hypothetical protein